MRSSCFVCYRPSTMLASTSAMWRARTGEPSRLQATRDLRHAACVACHQQVRLRFGDVSNLAVEHRF